MLSHIEPVLGQVGHMLGQAMLGICWAILGYVGASSGHVDMLG